MSKDEKVEKVIFSAKCPELTLLFEGVDWDSVVMSRESVRTTPALAPEWKASWFFSKWQKYASHASLSARKSAAKN